VAVLDTSRYCRRGGSRSDRPAALALMAMDAKVSASLSPEEHALGSKDLSVVAVDQAARE
jgi:hypothetical protein